MESSQSIKEIFLGEHPKCRMCGYADVYVLKNGAHKGFVKCKRCRHQLSEKQYTRMHNSKLSLDMWHKIIVIQLCNPCISSAKLAKTVGLTQKTMYYRQREIKSIIKTTGYTDPKSIINVIMNLDVKVKDIGKRKPKFSFNAIRTIRKNYSEGISKTTIARKFKTDASTVNKIVKYQLYASVTD